jgi:hypothetical protein
MTRAEAYAAGFAEGRRWAEEDIRDGLRLDPEDGETGEERAFEIGARRGYRDTFARFESGALTWEMFELEPIARGERE